MNHTETGTQMNMAELSRSRTGSYSALLNDILASPAEVPSLLLPSDDFRLPASATDWSLDQRFADLEVRLFERQEKMSETIRSMTRALDLLSKSVHVKQQVLLITSALPTKYFQSQLRPALPQAYDRSRSCGKISIHACQAYFRLRLDQFPDEQTKIQWAMTYMSRDRAQRFQLPKPGLRPLCQKGCRKLPVRRKLPLRPHPLPWLETNRSGKHLCWRLLVSISAFLLWPRSYIR
jgi:hypothetical protein